MTLHESSTTTSREYGRTGRMEFEPALLAWKSRVKFCPCKCFLIVLSNDAPEVRVSWFNNWFKFYFHVTAYWESYLKQHDVSLQSCTSLGETLFPVTREWIIAQIKILAKLSIYQSSSIEHFHDLIYWMVTNFIFDGVTLQTSHRFYANCQKRTAWVRKKT